MRPALSRSAAPFSAVAAAALPVTVVAIDQKSLLELGQWPWPRNLLARLVRTLSRDEPAAIGLNILMPESDALSPERLLAREKIEEPGLADALRALPTHDAQLAGAMAAAPTVLIVAGTPEATTRPLRAAPVMVQAAPGARGDAPPPAPAVPFYPGALSSIGELNRQASGWGLISVDPTRGVIRRMPLVASIGGTLVPSLSVEMLRVAQRLPELRLHRTHRQVAAVAGRINAVAGHAA